jgi:hypothetical protein
VELVYLDREILEEEGVQDLQQHRYQQVEVVEVLEEVEELDLVLEEEDLVVLDCQHFKEMMVFQLLMELLDHNQEDILLVVGEVVQTQQLLVLEDLVEVEKVLLDKHLEQQILAVAVAAGKPPMGLVLLVVQVS